MRALCIMAAMAALSAAPVAADMAPDRMSLLIGSNHIGGRGFNEDNKGLFATWEGNTFDLSAGVYHNSYHRVSVAGTVYARIFSDGEYDAGVFTGLAHYPETGRHEVTHVGGDFVLISGVQVRYKNMFTQVIPMDCEPVCAVVSFGITWGAK